MIEMNRVTIGDESVLSVKGALDESTCGLFEGMMQQLIQLGKPSILIDLHSVRRMDGTAERAIRQASKRARQSGRSFRVIPHGANYAD